MTGQCRRLDYKWVIVAVCFMIEFVALGFCSSNKSIFLSAITQALGIKRSLFAFNDSCRYVFAAVINLYFGAILQRLGVRKMVGLGFLCLMISTAIYATADSIWLFYVGGCFLGSGLSLGTTTMVSSIVKRWCKGPHAGKILGLVLGANGIGAAVAIQIMTPMIYAEGDLFGYRKAYWLVVPLLAVTGLLAAVLLRQAPEGETVSQDAGKKRRAHSWAGVDYAVARKWRYFPVTLVCVFLTGMMLQGIWGATAAHMLDCGLDAEYVAWVCSLQSLLMLASKFLTGVLHDRFGLRRTILFCDLCAVACMVLMALVSSSFLGRGIALAANVLGALALPLETVMISLIVNHLFGDASFDKLLGIVSAVNTAGFAFAAPVLNACYDLLGTYVPVLLGFAVMMAAVTVTFQRVIAAAEAHRVANQMVL